MIFRVVVSERAKKDLKKVPSYIVDKFDGWVDAVESDGLEVVRRISGYHDEALSGDRKGQRSIRLNRFYRAIYVIKHDGTAEFVRVEEVTKHEY